MRAWVEPEMQFIARYGPPTSRSFLEMGMIEVAISSWMLGPAVAVASSA